MGDQSSDDWLPSGWTVDFRVRKFGKRDKHYCAPSGQKFYSKLEVLRYLQNNLPKDIPQLEEGKDLCVDNWHRSSSPSEEKNEVSVDQCPVDMRNNGESCSPLSVEKEKTSPDISTYFSCNSMDSSSLASVEEKQVIEQNVEIHDGDTPNGSFLLPKDEKTNLDRAAMVIGGESTENKLQSVEITILHPSAEKHCAKNLERDSGLKETQTVSCDQSPMDASGRMARSSCPNSSQKRNSRRKNHAATKVVVEKCVAEGLPEGWIKEIKVKKKNGNVRRDPYYTDPVSGYVFRSMKDVLRYLKTGDIGRLAFKPKEKSSSDIELEEEETPSPLSKKQKLTETCSSENNEDVADLTEKVPSASSHSGHMEGLSIPECTRDECKVGSSKLSEAVGQEQSEEKNNCIMMDIVSVSEAKVLSEEPLNEKGVTGENKEHESSPPEINWPEHTPEESNNKECEPSAHRVACIECNPEGSKQMVPSVEESKETTPNSSDVKEKATRKPRRKKEINLPRRTSSRLAGVAVDPMLEIPSRASRGNLKQLGREESSEVQPEVQSMDLLRMGADLDCATRDEDARDAKSSVVPAPDVDSGKMGNDLVEKSALPFELPSQDILQDPCIEFAIKTLTGVNFNFSEDACQPSSGRKTGNTDRYGANLETEKYVNQKQGVGVVVAPQKPSLPEDHTINPYMEQTACEKQSSCLNFPCGDSWSDPCIEFAIKTLTGAIPVDYGLDVQDIIQQQMRASQIQESSDMTESHGGADNFCRTDLLWQHNNAADKTLYREQAGLFSTAPSHSGNVDLHLPRPSGSVRHQQLPDRGNKYRR